MKKEQQKQSQILRTPFSSANISAFVAACSQAASSASHRPLIALSLISVILSKSRYVGRGLFLFFFSFNPSSFELWLFQVKRDQLERKHVNKKLCWTFLKFVYSTVTSDAILKRLFFSSCHNYRVCFFLSQRDYQANLHIYITTLANSTEIYLLLWHISFHSPPWRVLDLHMKHERFLLILQGLTCEREQMTGFRPADEALISQNSSDWCGKECVAVTVRDKYNLSKRFPTFFLTALRDRFVHRNLDSPASQQHLVNHQSSLVILAGLELEKRKGDGNKKKKKSSLTLQGSKRRDINATSPHTSSFVFGASFQLRVAIFFFGL